MSDSDDGTSDETDEDFSSYDKYCQSPRRKTQAN